MRAGRESFIEDLVKHFPKEREAIEKWVYLCRDASRQDIYFKLKIVRPAWLARLLLWLSGKKFYSYLNMTALEAAQSVTNNTELQVRICYIRICVMSAKLPAYLSRILSFILQTPNSYVNFDTFTTINLTIFSVPLPHQNKFKK